LIDYGALSCLALVYGAANFLLAQAWYNILLSLKSPLPLLRAVRIYAVSQLAKYVPGNVFQFAGRQALGLAAGLPAWSLLKSMVWELALISVCGAIFGALVTPLLFTRITPTIATLIFVAAIVAIIFSAHILWNSRIAVAIICYFIFLVISGFVFLGVLIVANHEPTGVSTATIVGAFVVAWLFGLLTPGAPAGLGVREAILLVLLSDHVGDAKILLAAIVGRAITVLGDLLFYGAGRIMPRN